MKAEFVLIFLIWSNYIKSRKIYRKSMARVMVKMAVIRRSKVYRNLLMLIISLIMKPLRWLMGSICELISLKWAFSRQMLPLAAQRLAGFYQSIKSKSGQPPTPPKYASAKPPKMAPISSLSSTKSTFSALMEANLA